MAAPAVKTRKVPKDHTAEDIQFEEVVEVIARSTGYGKFAKQNTWEWQRDQLRKKSESRNIPES